MAWWLADSVINETMETDYPVKDINFDDPDRLEYGDPTHYVDGHGDVHLAKSKRDLSMSAEGDGYGHSPYYYDYDRNGLDGDPFEQSYLADNDDQAAHHFINNEVHEKEQLENIREESERKRDNRYKYHESEIIKEIEDYVSSTYNGHYTGDTHEYRNTQTIDLMAARSLASAFCQSNILKYGSRYGSKDGRNKKDLLKVIHYAMLLLHFDEHYGKPSMTSGNIDHNMP